ncbi:Delta(24)-sterol C-methyltransferase [Lecanora helva]
MQSKVATEFSEYYTLATDFYEYGWGASFHFCRFAQGEGFREAVTRHEHYLAHIMGLREGMKVLDVGCGIGGPAREIAKFAVVEIVGVNNYEYQVSRARKLSAVNKGVAQQLSFATEDFTQLSSPPDSFDAVYGIEATAHAHSLEAAYREIYRVLKPGGVFGLYEWLMTDRYDDDNPQHRTLRRGIEQGDGIPQMVTIAEAVRAIKAAGFILELHEDLAERPDASARPWYYPLDGDFRMARNVGDVFMIARMTQWGKIFLRNMIGGFEKVGLAHKGSGKTVDTLNEAADCLVAGGKQKLFTPMYLMVARKPRD